jgi:hypothetical protein
LLAVLLVLPLALTGAAAPATTNIPYADAKPIFESLRADLHPGDLRSKTVTEIEAAWPDWVVRHDAAIRARIERGDDDSIVNLLLFGVTFTKQPRIRESVIGKLAVDGRSADVVRDPIVRARITDLVAAIASSGATNERLQVAREMIERRGVDPTAAAARAKIRDYLETETVRVVSELESRAKQVTTLKDEHNRAGEFIELLTLFRDRGLSSDTTLFPDFAVEQALAAMKSGGTLRSAGVRRAAVVGPGLDFVDKREGFDFYPQQTLQPFALVDSLIRLGLASADAVQITTFDVNPRINSHIEAARQRAGAGVSYQLHLPRDLQWRWTSDLLTFWKQFGDRIGEEAKPLKVPPAAGRLQLRALRVRPATVLSIVPRDLNVVTQRLEPLGPEEQFDLIVATNILNYYTVFDQSLAVVNISRMLKPGGFLLANNELVLPAAAPMARIGHADAVYTDRENSGDRVVWYQRR